MPGQDFFHELDERWRITGLTFEVTAHLTHRRIMKLRHFILLLFLGLCAACASTYETAEPGTVQDARSLVGFLEDEGIVLISSGPVLQSPLTESGTEYEVRDAGRLQVFEYSDPARAAEEARSGGVGLNAHVYQNGPLVAVYLGNEILVQRALSRAMGDRAY